MRVLATLVLRLNVPGWTVYVSVESDGESWNAYGHPGERDEFYLAGVESGGRVREDGWRRPGDTNLGIATERPVTENYALAVRLATLAALRSAMGT